LTTREYNHKVILIVLKFLESYQLSNDVELKLANFLQLIGVIKRTIFRKVRTETVLKIHNIFSYIHFYMGQKNGL